VAVSELKGATVGAFATALRMAESGLEVIIRLGPVPLRPERDALQVTVRARKAPVDGEESAQWNAQEILDFRHSRFSGYRRTIELAYATDVLLGLIRLKIAEPTGDKPPEDNP
jgi:hypothetical protein